VIYTVVILIVHLLDTIKIKKKILCVCIMFIQETQACCTALSVCIVLQQEKAVAPIQPKKPNIKKKATDTSRKLQKNLIKKQNKEGTMVGKSYSSLTISAFY